MTERSNIVLPSNARCAFCDYLRGDRPYTILNRGTLVATLVTREQRGISHLLVLPIRHCQTILDATDEESTALMREIRHVARTIDRVYRRPGIAIWQNNGVTANQTIAHLHFHVAGTLDEGGTNWGEVPEISVVETDAIAARLRKAESSDTNGLEPCRGNVMAQQEHVLMTAEEVVGAYMEGRRHFHYVILDGAEFGDVNLRAASFYGASLRECHFERALLSHVSHVQFKNADLTGAFMADAALNATDLIGANFSRANLSCADLTGAALNYADCADADMRNVNLVNARLSGANLEGARFSGSSPSSTNFGDTNVSALCDARKLRHDGPSSIDPRTVIRSYHHSRFKGFMQDCGVPGLFADYMIDCARALGESLLRTLMQSTFISYGGPDEAFARKLYEALRKHGVTVFFFPESATWVRGSTIKSTFASRNMTE